MARAEEPLLFGGHREEEDAPPGRARRHERLGERDETGGSGGVVERAVEDVVALDVGVRAEMVPVRGVDHRLRGRLRASQPRHDIVRVDLPVRGFEPETGLDSERDRGEFRTRRRFARLLEVHPGCFEQRHRPLTGDPALDLQLVHVPVGAPEIELLAGPGAAHHLPRIPRRAGLVDDKRPERTHRGGFFELVGPAAVVGHRLPAEVVLARRIVHQDHQDLPGEIGVAEVVPPVLRRLDPVADEEQLSPGLDGRRHSPGPGHEVERRRPGAARIRRGLHGGGGAADERHRLEPAAVGVPRFESEFLEHSGQVGDRLFFPGGRGGAAAELVGGERGDVCEQPVLVETRRALTATGDEHPEERCGKQARERGSSHREASSGENGVCQNRRLSHRPALASRKPAGASRVPQTGGTPMAHFFSSTWPLVRTPVLITLAVTALRLLGALGGLPDVLVNREAGGTGAIIGIVWLAPIFAVWFGRRHSRAGDTGFVSALRTNFVYALGARIPVILIMLFATLGDWGTHYDAYPPDMADMSPLAQWFRGGVVAQLLFWVVLWTTLIGGLITWLTAKFTSKPAAA